MVECFPSVSDNRTEVVAACVFCRAELVVTSWKLATADVVTAIIFILISVVLVLDCFASDVVNSTDEVAACVFVEEGLVVSTCVFTITGVVVPATFDLIPSAELVVVAEASIISFAVVLLKNGPA